MNTPTIFLPRPGSGQELGHLKDFVSELRRCARENTERAAAAARDAARERAAAEGRRAPAARKAAGRTPTKTPKKAARTPGAPANAPLPSPLRGRDPNAPPLPPVPAWGPKPPGALASERAPPPPSPMRNYLFTNTEEYF